MRKYIHKTLDVIQQCDLFSSNIVIRYKADNDYKTLTSAFVSLALIIFFSVVFVNTFVSMVNRDTITSTVVISDSPDPSLYNTSTSNFMFAVGLNSLNMNVGNRYFNFVANQYAIVNGSKKITQISLSPCNITSWTRFGSEIVALYKRLNFDQWLCPSQNLSIQLQGKYTSNIFKYIKISVSNCTGIVNGQGCVSDSNISAFLNANDIFSFNFYFINTILNPGNQDPFSIFLDDTNNFAFSTQIGTSCNFFLQQFQMDTDNSLLPYNDIQTVTGGIAPTQAISSTYPINLNGQNSSLTFFKFYIRKSPLSQSISRSFAKFDTVLSYIGGLFGLIALVIQLPLNYYNLCCFQLSLATQMFQYKEKQKEQQNKKQDAKVATNSSLQEGQSKKNDDIIWENNQNEDLHDVKKFNFLYYLIFLPYLLLKKVGFKIFHHKIQPFYRALKQVRKQTDILTMLKRFGYLDKASNCLLDEHQRKLLHLFKKTNIDDLKQNRQKFKLQKRLQQELINLAVSEILQLGLKISPQIQRPETQFDRIKQSYQILKLRKDKISQQIMKNLDPQIRKQLEGSDFRLQSKVNIINLNNEIQMKQFHKQQIIQDGKQLQNSGIEYLKQNDGIEYLN